MMGGTSGAGTVYPSASPEFTPVFNGVHVNRSLVSCVLSFLYLAIELSVLLRFIDSD